VCYCIEENMQEERDPKMAPQKDQELGQNDRGIGGSVAKNPEDCERIRHEIHTLKNKKMFLMKNPNVLATKAPGMKKGSKTQKHGSKSPLASPESPDPDQNRDGPYPPFSHLPPYGQSALYGPYGSYTKSHSFGHAPYPLPYPDHQGQHRPRTSDSDCLSPSLVLNPVSTALSLQMYHPYVPLPGMVARAVESAMVVERNQWVPGANRPSAFTPLKPLHAKYPVPSVQPTLPSPHSPHHQSPPLQNYEDTHTPRVPQQRTSPSPPPPANNFFIQLPQIRLPHEKDKPKLSTLEPDLYAHGENSPAPTNGPNKETPSLPSPFPQWFDVEHHQRKDVKEEPGEVRVPVAQADGPLPSTVPLLSLGE